MARPYVDPQPHSCDYCQKVVIPIPKKAIKKFDVPVTIFIPINKERLLHAANDGCSFFSNFQELVVEDSTLYTRLTRILTGLYWQPNRFARLLAWLAGSALEVEIKLLATGRCELQVFGLNTRSPFSGSFLLDCYAYNDDPPACYISTRPVNQEVASNSSFQLAAQWLAECHTTHATGSKGVASFSPKRLLCVRSQDSAEVLYLRDTALESGCQYAALSYCWGTDQPEKTTQANLEANRQALNLNQLPKTIQDAITVTRRLNLNYLWVDSMCIIQDDKEDKVAELACIRDIFKSAYVTISASSAAICTDGFLHIRAMLKSPCPPLQARVRTPNGEFGNVMLSYGSERANTRPHAMEPIHSRAWTLEERHLSPRVLEYGTRQLQWICRSACHCDGGETIHKPLLEEDDLFKPIYSTSRSDSSTFNTWTAIVDQYTRRNMTKPSDRLIAISGLAQEYSEIFDDQYLAGLWRKQLALYLLWEVSLLAPRPSMYLGPTWSWASVGCKVGWDRELETRCLPSPHFELLEGVTSPLSPVVPFAAVHAGMLRVRARAKQIHLLHEADSEIRLSDSTGLQLRFSTFDAHFDEKQESKGNGSPTAAEFHMQLAQRFSLWTLEVGVDRELISFIRKRRGLILKRNIDSTFSRVAMFAISERSATLTQAGKSTSSPIIDVEAIFRGDDAPMVSAVEGWFADCKQLELSIL